MVFDLFFSLRDSENDLYIVHFWHASAAYQASSSWRDVSSQSTHGATSSTLETASD